MPKSRRAARIDTEKPATTSMKLITVHMKNSEVEAAGTTRNSTR